MEPDDWLIQIETSRLLELLPVKLSHGLPDGTALYLSGLGTWIEERVWISWRVDLVSADPLLGSSFGLFQATLARLWSLLLGLLLISSVAHLRNLFGYGSSTRSPDSLLLEILVGLKQFSLSEVVLLGSIIETPVEDQVTGLLIIPCLGGVKSLLASHALISCEEASADSVEVGPVLQGRTTMRA